MALIINTNYFLNKPLTRKCQMQVLVALLLYFCVINYIIFIVT